MVDKVTVFGVTEISVDCNVHNNYLVCCRGVYLVVCLSWSVVCSGCEKKRIWDIVLMDM